MVSEYGGEGGCEVGSVGGRKSGGCEGWTDGGDCNDQAELLFGPTIHFQLKINACANALSLCSSDTVNQFLPRMMLVLAQRID